MVGSLALSNTQSHENALRKWANVLVLFDKFVTVVPTWWELPNNFHLQLTFPPFVCVLTRYEVLYNQLGVSRLEEFAKLGLLDIQKVITMKVWDTNGCGSQTTRWSLCWWSLCCPWSLCYEFGLFARHTVASLIIIMLVNVYSLHACKCSWLQALRYCVFALTMLALQDLFDTGCVPKEIKYGVMLYSPVRRVFCCFCRSLNSLSEFISICCKSW